ncbi:phosphoglycerate kinase [Candidatus Deianiraea vastatrix]|uniref:Phosphoglycerate kinase n=1 Tax=Candidatus Deianiraea vastatrix TaxID=2163644 RepID=A0A5B8XIL0_9RICK|nr:phosphoglycerate kinase [Candidatus Deianiraea vastatrix]QED23497.1 Phosphoglycerate kinase [Candidatus Deianiraea vastatrix]
MNSVKDYPVTNTSVFLRCDLNVPMKDGCILDSHRIESSIPTIKYLLSSGAKVVIASHLGRPNGFDAKHSLKPICDELSRLLDIKIHFIKDITSQDSISLVKSLPFGTVCMLENLRFHKEEEAGDENFAKILSEYATCFVNDAFACSHRKHASVFTIAQFLPSFAGLNLLNEVEAINSSLSKNGKNFCIIGGSKISSKIGLVKNLIHKSSSIFLGGGMANTFLLASGYEIGLSICEEANVKDAQEIISICKKENCKLILPVDVIVSKSFEKPVNVRLVKLSEIQKDDFIVDVGFQTLKLIEEQITSSNNVIWNGPAGVYEVSPFNVGSFTIANLISHYTKNKSISSIVGGGDAVACANLSGTADEFSFVSTAGGAFLEYLEQNTLPGISVISIPIKR